MALMIVIQARDSIGRTVCDRMGMVINDHVTSYALATRADIGAPWLIELIERITQGMRDDALNSSDLDVTISVCEVIGKVYG